MKKIIRAVSVLLVALSFCLVFAGCDMIDELREQHAIVSEDKNVVVYQGKTFLRLPDGIPYFFNDVTSNTINITDHDVPVLLSEEFCHRGYYDPLSDIIAVSWVNKNLEVPNMVEEYTYFTQKENFKKYENLSAEEADRIGFYDYDSDFGTAMLSSEASEEILKTINTNDNWNTESIDNYTGYIYPLFKCNKELTLRGNLDGYEIYIVNETDAYLSDYYTGENIKLSEKASEEIIEKLSY